MTASAAIRLPAAAGWLLVFGAGIMPPLALLGPLGLAPLLAVLGVGCGIAWAVLRQRPPLPDRAVLLPLMAFVLWALVSAGWAADTAYTVQRGLRLIAETSCGLLVLATISALTRDERRRLHWALLAGLILVALLALVDVALSNALIKAVRGPTMLPTSANRSASVMALCLAPVLLVLWRTGRRWPAAGLALLVLASVLELESDTAKLALVLGGVLAILGALFGWLRRLYPTALRVGLMGLVLLMPLVPLALPPAVTLADKGIKASGLHRLIIWQFAAQRLMEAPTIGWGLDAARNLPGGKDIIEVPLGGGRVAKGEIMPLHPHNGPLQVWLELGAIGAVLLATTLALAVRRLYRLARDPAAVLAATAWGLTATIIACLSYGLWQSWWLGALWLSAAWLKAAMSEPPTSPAP